MTPVRASTESWALRRNDRFVAAWVDFWHRQGTAGTFVLAET
jgi:hypothetical protein